MSSTLFIAFLAAAAALVAAALLWGLRRGRQGRAEAARQLRALLAEYLEMLSLPAPAPDQAEAMWSLLERVRQLQRSHFPQVYAEMLTLSRLHAELAANWLKMHMERHGAPTGWDTLGGASPLPALRRQARDAVRMLDERCASLARRP